MILTMAPKQCTFLVKGSKCLVKHREWSTINEQSIGTVHLKKSKSLQITPPFLDSSDHSRLVEDIWRLIFQMLDQKALLRCARTCKGWLEIWMSMRDNTLLSLCSERGREFICKTPSLRKIRCSIVFSRDRMSDVLCSRTNLVVLKLRIAPVDDIDDTLNIILVNNQCLQHLEVVVTGSMDPEEVDLGGLCVPESPLKRLTTSSMDPEMLIRHLPHLERYDSLDDLDLNVFERAASPSLKIVTGCYLVGRLPYSPLKIEYLDIQVMTTTSWHDLCMFIGECPRLHRFRVRWIRSISTRTTPERLAHEAYDILSTFGETSIARYFDEGLDIRVERPGVASTVEDRVSIPPNSRIIASPQHLRDITLYERERAARQSLAKLRIF